MPGESREGLAVPVGPWASSHYPLHTELAGAAGARPSLRPLFTEGQRRCKARTDRVARTNAHVPFTAGPTAHSFRHFPAQQNPLWCPLRFVGSKRLIKQDQ